MPAIISTNQMALSASALTLLLHPVEPAHHVDETVSSEHASNSENLLGDWGGLRSRASDKGLDLTVQYLGETMGNVSGGIDTGWVYRGLMNFGVGVDFEKAFGWKGARFQSLALQPHGRSLTDNFSGDALRASNIDADNHLHLYELWLQQEIFGGQASLRAGQLAMDQEFASTERGALFINSAFGWLPVFDSAAPVYPQGAPGVRVYWAPTEPTYWQVAVVDGDINPHGTNPNGVKVQFDEGALVLSEFGYKWAVNNNPGTVKLGCWYHTASHEDVRWDNNGLSLASADSSGVPRSHDGNWGGYLVAEQSLWRENPDDKEDAQGCGMFTRVGYEPANRNFLTFYAEAGITSTGLIPGRKDDICGLGFAYGKISRELAGLARDDNALNAAGRALPDQEIVLEADYQFAIRAGLIIQPGVQYILHPGGSSELDNSFIVSLRAVLDF